MAYSTGLHPCSSTRKSFMLEAFFHRERPSCGQPFTDYNLRQPNSPHGCRALLHRRSCRSPFKHLTATTGSPLPISAVAVLRLLYSLFAHRKVISTDVAALISMCDWPVPWFAGILGNKITFRRAKTLYLGHPDAPLVKATCLKDLQRPHLSPKMYYECSPAKL